MYKITFILCSKEWNKCKRSVFIIYFLYDLKRKGKYYKEKYWLLVQWASFKEPYHHIYYSVSSKMFNHIQNWIIFIDYLFRFMVFCTIKDVIHLNRCISRQKIFVFNIYSHRSHEYFIRFRSSILISSCS